MSDEATTTNQSTSDGRKQPDARPSCAIPSEEYISLTGGPSCPVCAMANRTTPTAEQPPAPAMPAYMTHSLKPGPDRVSALAALKAFAKERQKPPTDWRLLQNETR